MYSTSKSIAGRPVKGQVRETVFRVAQYFKLDEEKCKLGYNIAYSTSKATDV
jgi:hypothetical protein